MSAGRVSVIISTKDRRALCLRCLGSLAAQTRVPDETLIIDAGGDPELKAQVLAMGERLPNLRYAHFPSSLTQARNYGIRNTEGDFVVFLDDDLVLEKDFIAAMLAVFAEDAKKEVAGIGGNMVGRPRNHQPLKEAFKTLLQLPCDGDGRFRLSGAPTVMFGSDKRQDVEFLPMGSTMWRREVFSQFLFDENLPGLGICEDVDFTYRVSRKWRNVFNPQAKLWHEYDVADRDRKWSYFRMELWTACYLFKKNLPKTPVYWAAFGLHLVGLCLRFAIRKPGRQTRLEHV